MTLAFFGWQQLILNYKKRTDHWPALISVINYGSDFIPASSFSYHHVSRRPVLRPGPDPDSYHPCTEWSRYPHLPTPPHQNRPSHKMVYLLHPAGDSVFLWNRIHHTVQKILPEAPPLTYEPDPAACLF